MSGTIARRKAVDVEIVDPRVDAEPQGWRDFCHRRGLPPVWDFQLMRVEAWLARNPPVLAVVHDAGRLVGACSVMICRPWRDKVFASRPSTHRRGPRPVWGEVYLPLLSGYPACVFDSALDAHSRRVALRHFERELTRYLGSGALGVVYRAMTEDVASAMAGRGRFVREIDPTAVMGNKWPRFEDWLACVPPSVRSTVERLATDRTLRISTGSARTDLDASELAALLNAHRARQDARAWNEGQRPRIAGLHLDTRSPISVAYLDALVRRTDVVTRVYREPGGRILAFNTMIDHPVSSAVHHWAALSTRDGGRRDLYVDAYAHCVRRMIDKGRPELTAGRTLLDVKEKLGFGTRPLRSVAVPRPVMGR